MQPNQAGKSIYTDGSYLETTGGTWHLEDSPLKAQHIVRLLARHPGIQPDSVCEIGCGAGGILGELQKLLPGHVAFTGYEISPQAHAISARFSNDRCHFVLGDAFADPAAYDLALAMDVVEHVEDCFSFLRRTRLKGRWKLYHIPLDTSAQAVLRGQNWWEDLGHIHLFTIETALKSLEYTGHRVVDWSFTDVAVARPKTALSRMANFARRPLARLSGKLAARLLGGYSILILAE
jgi:SAM-dependent methyltransferase